MPIAFPLGAIKEVEKVIEKVVEKIRYVYRNPVFKLEPSRFSLIKVEMPKPSTIVASFITGISNIIKIVWEYTPIQNFIQRLSYTLISKPSLPRPSTLASSFAVSVTRFFKLAWEYMPIRSTTQRLLYAPISRPALPSAPALIQMALSVVRLMAYRSHFFSKLSTLSFTVVSKPSLPSPLNLNTFSLSVGVRKTP